MKLFGTAAIIAGGKSSRMGFDKQLLPGSDKYMIDETIDALRSVFDDILVVTNTPELYENSDVRTCSDIYPGLGPLSGIHAALADTKSIYTFFIACDMPVVHIPFIEHLMERIKTSKKDLPDICISKTNGRLETFNSFYSSDMLPVIEEVLKDPNGRHSVFKFAQRKDIDTLIIDEDEVYHFDPNFRMFLNINTTKDFDAYYRSENMNLSDDIGIIRWEDGEISERPDNAVHEYTLTISVNGRHLTNKYCSPAGLYELVTGHLYAEGIISDMNEIHEIFINEASGSADVILSKEKENEGAGHMLPDDGDSHVADLAYEYVTNPDGVTDHDDSSLFSIEPLMANIDVFYDRSKLFMATGGVHKCALCDDTGILFSCIDVSRHNAFDKVVGKALMNDIPLEDKYMITSGRVPRDMMQKAVRSKIQMLVSRAAPTIEAVELGYENGITLLGFARKGRFNLYCGSALKVK